MNSKTGISVIFILFFISVSFASALTIEPGTILNTTRSNSSINFSFEVNVSYLEIEPDYIYLTNVTYYQSGVHGFCASINYSASDSVLDSSDFNCSPGSSPSGSGSASKPALPIYSSSFDLSQVDLNAGYTSDFRIGSEIHFPFENESRVLYVGGTSNNLALLSLDNGMSKSILAGEIWMIDLNKNNMTDFSITLNSMKTDSVNLTLRYVEERFETIPETNVSGKNESGIFDFFSGENTTPGHVIVGSGVIVLILAALFVMLRLFFRKKKHSPKHF